METSSRDRLIALAVTALAVILTVLILLLTGLHYDERLSKNQNPALIDDEEVFLDPELLLEQHKDIGEEHSEVEDEAAQVMKGEPEPAETEQPQTVNTGDNTKPAPEQKLIVRQEESAVTNASSDRKKEEEKVATSMKGKFSGKSGSVAGKFDSAGSSESAGGSGVTGRMSGRKFLGCPLPNVTLSHKTTVTVSITVDADGNVTSATASGATTGEIRRKCEEAARQARWSAKKGAASTRGTITFTIIPK